MDTPCVYWTGRIRTDGYGTIGSNMAHRRAWESVHGPIPTGMTLDHECHNNSTCTAGSACMHRRCINLDHLVLKTRTDNRAHGAKHHMSQRTHCPQGHAYDEANTGRTGNQRWCRTCKREKARAWRSRHPTPPATSRHRA